MKQNDCFSKVLPLMALGLFSLQPLLAFEPLTRDVVAMSQQQYQVTGIVTDEQGEPIIGANIVEKGSAIDTILIQHSLLECTSPVLC